MITYNFVPHFISKCLCILKINYKATKKKKKRASGYETLCAFYFYPHSSSVQGSKVKLKSLTYRVLFSPRKPELIWDIVMTA